MDYKQRPITSPSREPTKRISAADFHIAIICALSLEADAADALFDEYWQSKDFEKSKGDKNAYTIGRMGSHNIVLVHMPRMGKATAASVTANVKSTFTSLRLAFLTGICGASPYGENEQELILGDVIISEGVVQHDFGRQEPDKFYPKNKLEDCLSRPNVEIQSLIAKLKSLRGRSQLQAQMIDLYALILGKLGVDKAGCPALSTDRLFEPTYRHKHRHPLNCDKCNDCRGKDDPVCSQARNSTCEELGCQEHIIIRQRHIEAASMNQSPKPLIHFGRYASGDTVLRSAEHCDGLVAAEGVIAFEMEGAGAWDNLPCMIIKGACDYSDTHKNKKWQRYAAANAAACMRVVLEEILVTQPQPLSTTHPIQEISQEFEIESRNDSGSNFPHFLIPFSRDECFVGREDILAELSKAVSVSRDSVALWGIGGVGKSQIAIEFCYRYRLQFPGACVFWVHASNPARFEESYRKIARILKICKPEDPIKTVLDSVSEKLSSSETGPWLLIIDNADDGYFFSGASHDELTGPDNPVPPFRMVQFLPRSPKGLTLLTTRNRRVAQRFVDSYPIIHIHSLTPADGESLLRQKLGTAIGTFKEETTKLLELLEYLPLAISQAAAYMKEEDKDIPHYLELFDRYSQSRCVMENDYYEARRDRETPNAVFLTWQASFDEIRLRKPRAGEILSHIAFLDRHSIPEKLLRGRSEDQISFDTAIGDLKAYSFVSEQRGKGAFTVHRLVQLCTRTWVEKQGKTNLWQENALRSVSTACPLTAQFETWPDWERLMPHVECVLHFGTQDMTASLRQNSILSVLAKYDRKRGRVDLAKSRAERALEICNDIFGCNHPKTLDSMDTLAIIQKARGQLEHAEMLSQDVLRRRENILGKCHPHTFLTMNNLTRILCSRKKFGESEELSREICVRTEESLGPDHPDTLTALSDMGVTLSKMKQYERSEDLFRKSYEGRKTVLGQNNPDTLAAMQNLGSTLVHLGKQQEAEGILREALHISENYFGNGHPETLSIKNCIGSLLLDQGRFEDSQHMFLEITEMRLQIFGKEHPRTVMARDNLELVASISRANKTQR